MICINGAGIAGLTLANCLEKLKIDYFVIEKSDQLREVGAGIILQENGLAILRALDLLPYLKAADVEKMCFGSLRKSICLDQHKNYQLKAAHRGELQRLLLKNIDLTKIKLNREIKSYSNSKDNVQVTLRSGEIIECSLLIEASGIHGKIIANPDLEGTNQWCWRAIVPGKEMLRTGVECWFGKNRVGIFPISDIHSHENYYYIFQVLHRKSEINSTIEKKRLNWLVSIQDSIPELKNLDLSNAQWLSHALQQRSINWGEGRVIAIGDAAHALTPNLGQGAVLAMEDAYCLANLIQSGVTMHELLSLFVVKRHKRVKAVKMHSFNAGKSTHLAHPIPVFLRDLILTSLPISLIQKNQNRFMNDFIESMIPLH
jgi:2-polyprenyl-6-methoxyphenol hydroxylase-like FAD-dependent oxidoreductase